MKNEIKVTGIIKFDPPDYTAKHQNQSSWKRIAMVDIGSDISDYYAWFIERRYNIGLAPPLRGPHVTFINDRERDVKGDWEAVKKKWEGKEVEIILDINPKTDSANEHSKFHWWINIPHEHRGQLQGIRAELGLKKPFFGLHMTIGRAVDVAPEIDGLGRGAIRIKRMNVNQSIYIHDLIKKGKIQT